jgi:hypothetical protein
MERIGFSTGSLARGDVHSALRMLRGHRGSAIELSALRVHELAPLMRAVADLDLTPFEYVSVHAPSAFPAAAEGEVARLLLQVAGWGWRIILHPDAIHDPHHWLPFGDRLCIENMDVRKPGRTVGELEPVFDALPEASFCLDVAHAWQCDPTLTECLRLLRAFGHRLAEVHVSELDAGSRHVRLSFAAVGAFREIAPHLPAAVPLIIEAPVAPSEIEAEIAASLEALRRPAPIRHAA